MLTLWFSYYSLELPAEEIKSILEEATNVGGSHTVRFEAVHLRGTEDMSTQDVFDYFKGYAPASIEWINDYSCQFIFQSRFHWTTLALWIDFT